jgi:hypothetical protein
MAICGMFPEQFCYFSSLIVSFLFFKFHVLKCCRFVVSPFLVDVLIEEVADVWIGAQQDGALQTVHLVTQFLYINQIPYL